MKMGRPKLQTLTILGLALVGLSFGLGREFGGGTVPRAEAQTATPGADVEALRESIGNFFENLSDPNKGVRQALDDFLKNTPVGSDEKSLASLADGVKEVNANFGSYVAYEPIGFKTVGSDLVVFRYLYKCQDYPVVWYFTYYRPRPKTADESATSWTLVGFRFDSNLDAALRDASF